MSDFSEILTEIFRTVPRCAACNGTGMKHEMDARRKPLQPCPHCSGSGLCLEKKGTQH